MIKGMIKGTIKGIIAKCEHFLCNAANYIEAV